MVMDKNEILGTGLKDIIIALELDNYSDFCFNCDAACCLEVYHFTLLKVSR